VEIASTLALSGSSRSRASSEPGSLHSVFDWYRFLVALKTTLRPSPVNRPPPESPWRKVRRQTSQFGRTSLVRVDDISGDESGSEKRCDRPCPARATGRSTHGPFTGDGKASEMCRAGGAVPNYRSRVSLVALLRVLARHRPKLQRTELDRGRQWFGFVADLWPPGFPARWRERRHVCRWQARTEPVQMKTGPNGNPIALASCLLRLM